MKNKIIILIIVVILIIGLIICINISTDKNKSNFKNAITYRNEDNEYVIYNSSTNEVITKVTNEIDVKIYEDNPDYHPNP